MSLHGDNVSGQYNGRLLPDIVPLHFVVTQAPILVWFDSSIIDIISTFLVTMYYSRYVEL